MLVIALRVEDWIELFTCADGNNDEFVLFLGLPVTSSGPFGTHGRNNKRTEILVKIRKDM